LLPAQPFQVIAEIVAFTSISEFAENGASRQNTVSADGRVLGGDNARYGRDEFTVTVAAAGRIVRKIISIAQSLAEVETTRLCA
jgi:hypothetical protein